MPALGNQSRSNMRFRDFGHAESRLSIGSFIKKSATKSLLLSCAIITANRVQITQPKRQERIRRDAAPEPAVLLHNGR